MSEKKGKTIEELKEKVHSGLDLLSDEELEALFADAEVIEPAAVQPQPSEPEPSVAPASANPTPPVVEPPKGKADLMNLVPDKFKGEDEAASLAKMIKALQENEAALTQRSQELSQLQNVVQELSRKPTVEPSYQPVSPAVPSAAQPTTPEPEEDIDDLGFLDSPVENSKKLILQLAGRIAEDVARKVSVEQIRDYDTFALRRTAFSEFRRNNPDFDQYREEFNTACRLRPEWDNDINGLPKLFELAKQLKAAKGPVAPAVTQPQPTPASVAQSIDIEKLKAEIRAEVEASAKEKVKQELLEEIRRRKAAAGTLSTSPGSTPADRLAPSTTTEPMTPAEKEIQAMIDSGPTALRELNPFGPSLQLQAASK